MLPIVWTRTSRADVQAIVRYIIADHQEPSAGRKVYDELVDQVERLSKGSLIHHSHPDAPKDWYYLRHKRWLIFYRVDEVGLYIMRVIDVARDLPSLLRGTD